MTTDAHLTDLAGIRREDADRSVAEVRSADSTDQASFKAALALRTAAGWLDLGVDGLARDLVRRAAKAWDERWDELRAEQALTGRAEAAEHRSTESEHRSTEAQNGDHR